MDKIQKEIETKVEQLVQSSPLAKKASNGTLQRSEMSEDLFNILIVLEETPRSLARAAEKSSELGFQTLSDYYKVKQSEELGHDEWAKSDLKFYPIADSSSYSIRSETDEILNFIRTLIEKDPRLYIAYMTFVEYLTVRGTGGFLKDLDEKCGIPSCQASALANHEEKDRYHSQENFEFIKSMSIDPVLMEEMLSVVGSTHHSILKVMNACVSQ